MSNRCRLVCALAGAFAMCGCGLSAQVARRAMPLEKTHWKLEWIAGAKVEAISPDRAPFVELDPVSHRMSGSGGCNQVTGPYAMKGDHLRFSRVARTMMACRNMGTENALVGMLEKVREWKVAGSKLSLLDANGQVLARFVATE